MGGGSYATATTEDLRPRYIGPLPARPPVSFDLGDETSQQAIADAVEGVIP